jgi:aspartate/methionine/tyrosine aminotransferase
MANWQAERMKHIPFSGIRKVFEQARKLEKEGHRVINLGIGRSDFDTPAHIKQAAKQALDAGMVHYSSNYGLPELREAIATKLEQDNGLTYDPGSEIIVTVGTNEAVLMAMAATLNPDDEVIIPNPAWLHYFYCARLTGAVPVAVPLHEEMEFKLNPDDVTRAITPRTRMLVVTTPHNPTGSVLDEETLKALADIAEKHDLIVLSDEIYEKIIYDGVEHVSFASLPGMRERTLMVNGFSKAYAMDGWRLGYVTAPSELIAVLIRVHQYTTVCATTFIQMGALAAYRGSQDTVAEMVAEFDCRRQYLIRALNETEGISCVWPRGAFYAFPSIKTTGKSSAEIADLLLEEAKVAIVPGSAFGQYGEGYLRIAYSNSLENIQEAMIRIKVALGKM